MTLLLIFLVGLILSANLDACTLWGAAGADASGGTIISKNRDWKPDHTQVLKMHRSKKGCTYFGLYVEGNDEPGIKGGVNEKGLTVITASASSVPKSMRDNQPGKHGVISALLSGRANCDEVWAKKNEVFPNARTMFVMISDRRKILLVEVGLNGKYAIKTIENGPVVHTNHFLEKSLAEFNIRTGTSSSMRLARITHLMKTPAKPCTIDSFAAISRDQHDGPDNSLWRTSKSERTMASWITETPAQGPVKLRVVLANPGEQEQTHTFILDQKFWRETK
jgi:hypothetical protein